MKKNNNRDDFSPKVKEILAKRVNFICCNPDCQGYTLGPSSENDKFVNLGVASHICAAAPGGKRYDPNMTPEERSSIDNAIWMCYKCSKLIDSDEEKYTVELLKKWKRDMELKVEQGAINPRLNKNISNDELINIFEKSNIELVRIKENVSPFSNREFNKYIEQFNELEDYIYCNEFGNLFEKQYTFKDEVLKYGKKLLDWLIGKRSFPVKDLKWFYNKIKKKYKIENEDVFAKRWDALYYYFSNDLEKSQKIYIELLESEKCKNLEWFYGDILIDGRNITTLLEENRKKKCYDNIFQIEIEKNNYKIVYPNIDRIRSNLYENVIKNIFDYQNKSKYTQFFGIGLQYVLNSIQELLYISMFYGSITHLRLVRNILADVLCMYANCYGDNIFYKNALKYLVLSGKYNEYKKIYNKIRIDNSFVNKSDFINDILNLKKSILNFDINKYYILIYEIYGQYLDEDKYLKLEYKMLKMMSGRIDSNTYLIFRAISVNIERFYNKKYLFEILIKYIDKNYTNLFFKYAEILNQIKFKNLDEEEKDLYINLIKKCKNVNNIDVIKSMIEIKENTKKNYFDDILLQNKISEKYMYNLNNIEVLEKIIFHINKRVREREENPSSHSWGGNQYYIGYGYFKSGVYNDKIKKIVENQIIPLANNILISKNQYYIEKINIIKCLTNIALIENDTKILANINELLDNAELSSARSRIPFFNEKEEIDLLINIEMLKYALGKVSINDLLQFYLLKSIENNSTLNEIIKCIAIIYKNKMPRKSEIYIIYCIYKLSIKSTDLDIIEETINISYLFINSIYFNEIIKILSDIIEEDNYEKSFFIIKSIYKMDNKTKKRFNEIVENLKKSNNYNIKYLLNEYLE